MRSRTTIETNTLIKNLYIDYDIHQPSKSNFGVSWTLFHDGVLFDDPTYFTVTATQVSIHNDYANDNVTRNEQSLRVEQCHDHFIDILGEENIKNLNSSQYT